MHTAFASSFYKYTCTYIVFTIQYEANRSYFYSVVEAPKWGWPAGKAPDSESLSKGGQSCNTFSNTRPNVLKNTSFSGEN